MKKRSHLGATAVIVGFWLYAIFPFWRAGIANPDDMLVAIYKVAELDRCWKGGILFPRLGPDLAFGYGVTLFQFYHPLVSYIAEIFHLVGLGPIEAVKGTFSLGLLLSGLAMYVYALSVLRATPGALLAAIAYMYAPYQLLDIYMRGALAESFALCLLPLSLWSFDRLYKTNKPAYLVLASVILGALILAHHVIAFFFVPLLLTYLLFLAIRAPCGKALVLVGIAILLGLGLGAFYWLPALLEKSYTYLDTVTLRHGSSPASQLLAVKDALQYSLVFDYWAPSSYRLGLAMALLLCLALGLSFFHHREVRPSLLLFGAVVVICVGLQIREARLFWERVPLAQFILFPWRLLGFASLGAAVLVGSIPGSVSVLVQKLGGAFRSILPPLGLGQWILTGILALMIVLTGTLQLAASLSPWWTSLSNKELTLESLFGAGRVTARDIITDFQPIWTQEYLPPVAESFWRPDGPPIVSSPASLRMEVLEHGLQYYDLRTFSPQSFPLRLHAFYFPGWQGYLDGVRVLTYPSTALGLVTVDIPAGEHRIMLRFEDTRVRRVSTLISLVALSALVFCCICRWRTGIAVGGIASLLVIALAVWHIRPLAFTQSPFPAEADLQDKIKLLGYVLDKSVYSPGETAGLTLYWLGLQEMSEDYTVFVHLVEDDSMGRFGQHDGWPVYGLAPTTRWEPGEVVVDRHEFTIDASAPPGQYRIFVGMYLLSTMERLQVWDATVKVSGNAALIGEVTVREAGQ